MDYQFRPLTVWPTKPTANRRKSPFRAGYADTIKLLAHELRFLQARNVVIQLALSAQDFRRDGMPRVDSRPMHPGVILSFDSRHGPLSYPCDTFTEWEANVRAIAMSLENLRAVDRYGVTKRGEQYQGWTALPAPKPTGKFATVGDAAIFLGRLSGFAGIDIVRSADTLAAAYRVAVMKTHPDRSGDPEEFRRVTEAKEIIEKHHQGK